MAGAAQGRAPDTAGVVGLLLAAGSSTRFGSDKLAAPLPGAEPPCTVLEASARALLAACPRAYAALAPSKHGGAQAARLAQLGLRVLHPPESAAGMGATLAALVRAASADDAGGAAGGWLVMLADLPFVRPASVAAVAARLAACAEPRLSVVVPCLRGRRGHPVAFGAGLTAALARLDGDQGARALVDAAAAAGRLRLLELDDPGIVHDVDTPQALAAAPGTWATTGTIPASGTTSGAAYVTAPREAPCAVPAPPRPRA
jgi:molybdenum cofactor cytidylyltransferase